MKVIMWLHKCAKLLTVKLISLKHHKIGEKHHEYFSRYITFWKMLRCAHSKHSTSRVSNAKLWSPNLHTGQSYPDALWTAGYSPASIFTSVFARTSVLIQNFHSKEELKVTWHCARAQATRTWDDQYWWFFPLPSPKGMSWTVMSSSVKMISLPAIPQAQVLHGSTEAQLLGQLILWSVMSHAKIATQLKSLNLLTQIDFLFEPTNK